MSAISLRSLAVNLFQHSHSPNRAPHFTHCTLSRTILSSGLVMVHLVDLAAVMVSCVYLVFAAMQLPRDQTHAEHAEEQLAKRHFSQWP